MEGRRADGHATGADREHTNSGKSPLDASAFDANLMKIGIAAIAISVLGLIISLYYP